MAKLYDDDFLEWDVWVASGRRGTPAPARIVFRCVTDPGQRPRAVEIAEGSGRAEALVQEAGTGELRDLLQRAEPIR